MSFIEQDIADLFQDEEAQAILLEDAFETGDASYILKSLRLIAQIKMKNKVKLAQEIGISRQGVDKLLADDGNPTLSSLLALLNALNIQLTPRFKTVAQL
jgi:probable addiction module antidote protein